MNAQPEPEEIDDPKNERRKLIIESLKALGIEAITAAACFGRGDHELIIFGCAEPQHRDELILSLSKLLDVPTPYIR